MLMSRLCQQYGKGMENKLVRGFQNDLKSELNSSSNNHYPAYSHRVRLLDRWFDLSLQQLIHNEPKLQLLEIERKKKPAKWSDFRSLPRCFLL